MRTVYIGSIPRELNRVMFLHAYKSAKECDSQLIILHETISCLLYSKSNVGTLNFVVQITVYPNSIG